jgi:hypothetical protein
MTEVTVLTEEYPLTAAQTADYRRDGHVLLRGVASPGEVSFFRPILQKAVQQFKTESRPLEERDTYGKAFLQIGNLWKRDELAAKFTLSRRFAKIAADLMGVEGVRLYHDQALFKEPGGGITPWHQDHHYWPLDTDHTITLWMPLVDITPKDGPMFFASGSHLEGSATDLGISDESESLLSGFVRAKGYRISETPPLSAGDATFHSGWTLHGALPNLGTADREVMTVIYFAEGVRISKPENPHQEADLKSFFPGGIPGEPAAGELTPLLYKR